MITAITALFTVLTSGAGGGILGGVFGIFRQSQERKERIEMARVELERDQLDYKNAKEERSHALLMLEKTGDIELETIKVESNAHIEVTNQKALSNAQEVFKDLNTTKGMDNYRASVRPSVAYWAVVLFTVMLSWSFWKFNETIDTETGKQILIGMFATLTFTLTSVISFYYVSRRNSK